MFPDAATLNVSNDIKIDCTFFLKQTTTVTNLYVNFLTNIPQFVTNVVLDSKIYQFLCFDFPDFSKNL